MAAIGSSAQRSSSTHSARAHAVVRRRLVVGILSVLSLALVTVYFRESDGGFLHGLQSTGASVLRPFEVAADRVASPFEDAAGWFGDLLHARSDNKKLRKEVDQLREQAIVNLSALRENAQLKQLLKYLESPRYPEDYRPVTARVIARAPSQFAQQIVVSAGKNNGISKHDAVVTAEGLVGEVTKVASNVSQVTLLTDDSSAVSAVDIATNASGIAQQGISGSLTVDRVTKDQVVARGDVLVTAGWRSGDLSSLYPRGIPLCLVTQVGQSDTDLYKQIQCDPFVDFSTLEAVIVLVKKAKAP
ncbi:MAG TPA: rod shape-determining protein MreC [Gaiellaceae bacterium]